jgi:predicted hydrocarbon binding protein
MMSSSAATTREVAVPVSVFEALRSELEKDAGTLSTVRAMHHAGYEAGLVAAAGVNRAAGFWGHLSAYFEKRGWGSLTHRAAHPAVAILSSRDWAEAAPDSPSPEGACSFSAGFLSGLLSQLAGGAIAVLEVECRSRGDQACSFAFGSETAIHDLYGQMLEEADLERALQAL